MYDGRPFFLELFDRVNTFLNLANRFKKANNGVNVNGVLTVFIYTIFEKKKDVISKKKSIIINIEKTKQSTLRCDGV